MSAATTTPPATTAHIYRYPGGYAVCIPGHPHPVATCDTIAEACDVVEALTKRN